MVDQLNVRHHKAVAVGGAEIDGVAVSWPAVGSGTVAQAGSTPPIGSARAGSISARRSSA